MGQSVHCFPHRYGGCALSVQKKKLISQMLKQVYFPSKPATGKDLLIYG